MEIVLAAEKIFSIGGIGISNSVFSAMVVAGLIILAAILISRKLSFEHPGKLQLAIEMIVELLMSQISDSLGKEKTQKIFAFVFTFFVFILVSNLFGLMPFVPAIAFNKAAEGESHGAVQAQTAETVQNSDTANPQAETASASNPETTGTGENTAAELSIGSCLQTKDCFITTAGVEKFSEAVHLFRAPTSDLSMTITMAIISVVMTNLMGIFSLKLSYLKKFFNFKDAISAVVGILELVSEFSRIISFSFRLFGNIFAGETLLAVITNLSFGIATLPFLFLELFVAVIQAFVFFMLTSIFIGLATSKHQE